MLKRILKKIMKILHMREEDTALHSPSALFKDPPGHFFCGHEVDAVESSIEEYVHLAHHSSLNNSTIGKRTSLGRYSKAAFADIGAYCSISWDVTIGALSHPMDRVSMHAFSYRKLFHLVDADTDFPQKRTIIGNDVWIGAGVIVISGVRIGDGAVVGAGSVVTRDVEPYSVVAGVPARKLRMRFDEETVRILQDAQWWEWEDELIRKNMNLFDSPLTPEILQEMKRISCERQIIQTVSALPIRFPDAEKGW